MCVCVCHSLQYYSVNELALACSERSWARVEGSRWKSHFESFPLPVPAIVPVSHTWQRQRERILLSRTKPVLLVYRLKRGEEKGEYSDGKRGPLWQPLAVVCQLKRPSGPKAAAVPTTCWALSPSSLPSPCAFFLCLSPSSVQWLSGPGLIQAEASWHKKEKKKEGPKRDRKKINFLSGREDRVKGDRHT